MSVVNERPSLSRLHVNLQILVHGEQNEMARLKAALIREYEDNDQVHIEVHNPRNTEAVTLNFRGEKLAKVNKLNACRSLFILIRVSWSDVPLGVPLD